MSCDCESIRPIAVESLAAAIVRLEGRYVYAKSALLAFHNLCPCDCFHAVVHGDDCDGADTYWQYWTQVRVMDFDSDDCGIEM